MSRPRLLAVLAAAMLATTGCGSDDGAAKGGGPDRFVGSARVDDIARGQMKAGRDVSVGGVAYRLRGEGLVLVQTGFALVVEMSDEAAAEVTDGARVVVSATTAEQDEKTAARLGRRNQAGSEAPNPSAGQRALAQSEIGPGSFYLRDGRVKTGGTRPGVT